jgi:threonine/homoserine/homoserine lactone efflux protein
MTIEFLSVSLIVVATPGTGALYTMTAALSAGVRASLVAALGCTLGIIPHMTAAILGVATLLRTSEIAFRVLEYGGIAYLLYTAWSIVADKGSLTAKPGQADRSAAKIITSAVLVNLLNPKLTLFFFAFLPQFVGLSDPNAVSRMVGLSGIFMLLTLVIFIGYGALAGVVRGRILAHPRVLTWLRRTCAGAFVVLAGLAVKNA